MSDNEHISNSVIIKLTNLNSMTLRGVCKIDSHYLRKLTRLTYLDIGNNNLISKIIRMTQLLDLNIGLDCGVSQRHLKRLTKLTRIDVTRNEKIKCLTCLKNLEELIVYRKSDRVLDKKSIFGLHKLQNIYLRSDE